MKYRLTRISGLVLLGANVPLLTGAASGKWLSLLEFQRDLIHQGEIWRLVTGQLIHWSAAHFRADASAFLLLSLFLERHSHQRRMLALLPVSAVLIGVLLFFLDGNLGAYRGSSGIVHALFVLMAGEMIRETRDRPGWRIVWIWVLAAGVLKPILEVIMGRWLLPSDTLGYMGDPTPLAHLGGVIGVMALYTVIFISRRWFRALVQLNGNAYKISKLHYGLIRGQHPDFLRQKPVPDDISHSTEPVPKATLSEITVEGRLFLFLAETTCLLLVKKRLVPYPELSDNEMNGRWRIARNHHGVAG